MPRSVRTAIALAIGIAVASCATRKPPNPGTLAPPVTTAIMEIAPGIPVAARAAMPPGFEPLPFHPPLWLRDGRDVAVIGSLRGRTMLIDFVPDREQTNVLAMDNPPDAPDATLADIAVSPDRWSLAIATARANGNRLDLLRYDLAHDQAHRIASIEGKFESVSLGWPVANTIALGLRRPPPQKPAETNPPRTTVPAAPGADTAEAAGSSIFLVAADGSGPPEQLPFNCPLSALSWGPDGIWAVGQGDAVAPPSLIDRRRKSCMPLNVPGPIRVLGWAPSGGAFLFVGPTAGNPLSSAYQFDIPTRQAAPVAISSSAAVYVSDTSILAIGNRELTSERAIAHPRALITAEVALMDMSRSDVKVRTLGVDTFPEMLASSAMTYSPNFAMAAIELFAPGGTAAFRHIIAYSAKTGGETLLASGPAIGLALMSWSPDGSTLALFDGDSGRSQLTLLLPGTGAAQPSAPPEVIPPRLEAVVPPAPAVH